MLPSICVYVCVLDFFLDNGGFLAMVVFYIIIYIERDEKDLLCWLLNISSLLSLRVFTCN